MTWSISRGIHITAMYTARHCNEDAVLRNDVFVCTECGRILERQEAISRYRITSLERDAAERIERAANHERFVESQLTEMGQQVHSCPMCGEDISVFTTESDGISGICQSCQSPFFIGID